MALAALILTLPGLIGAGYLIAAHRAVRRFTRRQWKATAGAPVTVLKPLHGAEPELYENLRSFCLQAYPAFQIVFAVREAADPAAAVARRLIAELPGHDLELVVDPRVAGSNYKVANLENALGCARHPLLVIADSDMRVGDDYLAAVTAPLADPAIGLVTCLYRGLPIGGLASRLGAMFVNYGFLPAALVGDWTRPGEGCFGATMALPRAVLEAAGGFARLRDVLADDYALGAAVRAIGKRVVLSPYLVDTVIAEPSLAALLRHELRWARTIRAVAPYGFAASIVTHATALSALGAIIGGLRPVGLGAFAIVLACRYATIRATGRATGASAAPLWLVPLRDLLSFLVFIASFFANRVAWRDRKFRVAADGRLVADGEPRA